MSNKKPNLKKVNKANASTVKTLASHCGCAGKPVAAFALGYLNNFANN